MRIGGGLAVLMLAGSLASWPACAAPQPTSGGMEPEAATPDPNTPPEAPAVAPAPSAVSPVAATPVPAPAALSAIGERIKAGLAADPAKLSAADREDRTALQAFYESRNYASVWIEGDKLSARAEAAGAEIRRADDWGLKASAFDLPAAPTATAGSDELKQQLADAELKLDLAILKYARFARGGRIEPTSLSHNLDRRPVLFEPQGVMAGIAGSEATDKYLQALHPQHPQFERLRQKYLAAKGGTLASEPEPAAEPRSDRGRKKGSVAAAPAARTNHSGLARRLLANMEQWRWMPPELGALYVMDNIPEYMTRVVKNGKVIFTEKIVVGMVDKQTPVFTQPMEFIVFHPEWGVPDGIKMKEILPGLRRSSGGGFFGFGDDEPAILRQHGLKVSYRGRMIDAGKVNWATADIRQYQFSQPPGAKNVLGVVKFRFPNKHDVYMHDTPTKGLFGASVRTYSHGCMRVQNPVRLAEILLHEDRGWSADKVAGLVNGGPSNNSITLNTKIPVHVTYFTAWVDDDGKLRTYGDPYGHEERISAALEGRAAYLVASARPTPGEAVEDDGAPRQRKGGRRVASSKSGAPQNWLQGLFGN